MNFKWHNLGVILFLLCHATVGAAENLPLTCDANHGLSLLNQTNPPFTEIQTMLNVCDKSMPDNVQVLLLHGLLARKEGMKNNHYVKAISWLEKARAIAPNNTNIPALELAVTYEWAEQQSKAQVVYEQILAKTPNSRPALLGLARTQTANNDLEKAHAIYKQLLSANAQDLEALNGIGRIMMAKKEFDEAATYFNQVLSQQPNNVDAQIGLKQVTELAQQKIQLDTTIAPIFACDPNQGLKLINQANPPLLLVQQILLNCSRAKETNVQILLLHGLNERAQKKYPQAIEWLKKAKAIATQDNPIPALELANTYEIQQQFLTAQSIYDSLLKATPDLRPALLGKARIAMWQNNAAEAQRIYMMLLQKNQQDIDVLNGMARVKMTLKEYHAAQNYFTKALHLQPKNPDALIGMQQLAKAQIVAKPSPQPIIKEKVSPCDPAQGLILVNQKKSSFSAVQQILNYCDQFKPKDTQVLLLHGLYERTQKNYSEAIRWLIQAKNTAPNDDFVPAQELALTYEWSLQLKKAKAIYQELLRKKPGFRPALLGEARIATAEYHIHIASLIYSQLLTTNPKDVDALNGMARAKMINKQFKQARTYFNEALQLQPGNSDSLSGLEQLNNSTRYMMSFNQGQYRVQNQASNSSVLYGHADINATDRIIGIATHNSKQLDLDITVEPTILPNNSLFLGFQRQIPGKYGWGVNYDYRQHKGLPVESRVGGTGNLYLLSQLQLFGGFWSGFPSPWKNQLYFSGLTYYTKLPFNFTVTGFWGNQEIGGQNDTYAFDLSKELANSAFYALGTSYNTTQKFWSYHGRIIWPTFKNQALEGSVEKYDFNGILIFGLGWRVYWA